jgi:hypothetical protein
MSGTDNQPCRAALLHNHVHSALGVQANKQQQMVGDRSSLHAVTHLCQLQDSQALTFTSLPLSPPSKPKE